MVIEGDDFGDESDHRSIPYIPVIFSWKDILILEFMEVGSDVTVTIVGKNQVLLSYPFGAIFWEILYSIDTYTRSLFIELSNSQGGYIYGWFELK